MCCICVGHTASCPLLSAGFCLLGLESFLRNVGHKASGSCRVSWWVHGHCQERFCAFFPGWACYELRGQRGMLIHLTNTVALLLWGKWNWLSFPYKAPALVSSLCCTASSSTWVVIDVTAGHITLCELMQELLTQTHSGAVDGPSFLWDRPSLKFVFLADLLESYNFESFTTNMTVSVFSIFFLFLLTPVHFYYWHDQPFCLFSLISLWHGLIRLQWWEHFPVSAPLVWSICCQDALYVSKPTYWSKKCCFP